MCCASICVSNVPIAHRMKWTHWYQCRHAYVNNLINLIRRRRRNVKTRHRSANLLWLPLESTIQCRFVNKIKSNYSVQSCEIVVIQHAYITCVHENKMVIIETKLYELQLKYLRTSIKLDYTSIMCNRSTNFIRRYNYLWNDAMYDKKLF